MILASNHIGIIDGPLLAVFSPRPVHVLTKQEMFEGRLGRFLRASGQIPLDRFHADPGAIRSCLRVVRDGGVAGIFPEGTRVAPGEQPPIKSGFAGLYRLLNLPTVPVAVDSGRLWPKRGPKRAGVITFRFGEVIPPGLGREEIEVRVHAAMNVLDR